MHVEARGLEPGREYWYRFEAGGHVSPIARTKTAPAPGQPTSTLSFASVSCQAYDYGFFTSYPHIVEDDPDFVLHLGDYIYEYGMSATAGNRDDQGARRSCSERHGPCASGGRRTRSTSRTLTSRPPTRGCRS